MWKTSHGNRFPESFSGTLCRHGDRIGPHRITTEDLPESTRQVGMDCGATLGHLTLQGTQTPAGSERMGPRADAMPRPLARETLWLLVPLPTSTPSLPDGMETQSQGGEGRSWLASLQTRRLRLRIGSAPFTQPASVCPRIFSTHTRRGP